MHSLGTGGIVITAAVLLWVVTRQVQTKPLATRTSFRLPAILACSATQASATRCC